MLVIFVLGLLQLIAVAALFLASKSEETPCPLNNVVRASCEIFHKQDITFLSYLLPFVSILQADS
jgi:cyclin T